MSKNIKHYHHLYVGCEVTAPNPYNEKAQAKGYLTGIHGEYGPEVQFIIDGNAEESPEYPNFENVKPILRRLSSMTPDELRELTGNNYADSFARDIIANINTSLFEFYKFVSRYGDYDTIPWLLRNGFDLFGLIDAGLAIDSDKK